MFIISKVENRGYTILIISVTLIVYTKELFSALYLFSTWNLSKKFSWTGRSLWERRTSLVDTVAVKLFKSSNRIWARCVSTFIWWTEASEMAHYLAISDRPNFPSPFRSNILSYKVEAEQRGKKRQRSEMERNGFFYRYMLSRWRQCGHWISLAEKQNGLP